MNESYILIACFIITFSFIGYKVSGFIKKMLDRYSEEVSNKIAESEKIKIEAVNEFDKAQKKMDELNDNIVQLKRKAEEIIENNSEQFFENCDKMIKRIRKEHKEKMDIEKENIINDVKKRIISSILESINNYENLSSKEQKEKAIAVAIKGINFKKLVK